MRTIIFAATFFCAFCPVTDAQVITSFPPETPVSQTLVPVNGFPENLTEFLQSWLDQMTGVIFEITEPYSSAPLTVEIAPRDILTTECIGACSVPGEIFFPTDQSPANISSTYRFYYDCLITYEWMHQITHALDLDIGTSEARARGATDLTLVTSARQNPSLFSDVLGIPTVTCTPAIDTRNTLRLTVFGGAGTVGQSNFYDNVDNDYESSCSLLSLFINKLGGNYRILDHLLKTEDTQTRDAFLSLVDSLGITIDGVNPSTFFRRDVTNFAGAPNGRYFGIVSQGGDNLKYNEAMGSGGAWSFNPFGYVPIIVEFAALPSIGQHPTVLHGWVRWTVTDVNGKVIATQTVKDTDGIQFQGNPVIDPDAHNSNGDWGWYAHYPAGAYKLDAEYIDGTNAGEKNPWYTDTSYFAIVNEDLSPCDIAVTMNGPRWGELTTNRSLALLSPAAPNSIHTETYPGLVIFRNLPKESDGSCKDLTVTDGSRIRTFTPDPLAPASRDFTLREEPILLSFERATDFKPTGDITPGGIYTLSGAAFTNNDAVVATSYPLATEGCPGTPTNNQGLTEVVFVTQDGARHKTPILYCGYGQMNIEAPLELNPGETVTVVVSLNGTDSRQPIQLNVVAADPASFGNNPVTTWIGNVPTTTWMAAAVFANGAKAWQPVTAQNPARLGNVIALFVTGLGAKAHPGEDGVPMQTANPAIAAISVTVDGIPAHVLYSGCAPGYAGLDQINFVVPPGISGDSAIVITADGASAPPVILAVAKN